jgi:hypothetical protein
MRLSRLSVLPLLLLSLFLSACPAPKAPPEPASPSPQASLTPQPTAAEIQGVIAAIDDPDPGVRDLAFFHLAGYDPKLLPNPAAIAAKAMQHLQDPKLKQLEQEQRFATELRTGAAAILGKLGPTTVPYLPTLAKFLKNPDLDPALTVEVMGIFAGMGSDAMPYVADIERLARQGEAGSGTTYQALRALATLDTPTTPTAKILLAIAQDQTVAALNRAPALKELAQTPTARNYSNEIGQIFRNSRDFTNDTLFCEATAALGKLGNAAQPYVEELWNSYRNKQLPALFQDCALQAFGDLDELAEPYVGRLLQIVQSRSDRGHGEVLAARLLGEIGVGMYPHIPQLISMLADERLDFNLRLHLARSLAKLGAAATRPHEQQLIQLVQNTKVDLRVRAGVVWSLGQSEPGLQLLFQLAEAAEDPKQLPLAVNAACAIQTAQTRLRPHARRVVAIAQRYATRLGGWPDIYNDTYDYAGCTFGLPHLGDAAQPYAKDIVALVRNPKLLRPLRLAAGEALINLGAAGKPYAQDLTALLLTVVPCGFDDVEPFAFNFTRTLSQLGPLSAVELKPFADALPKQNCRLGRDYMRLMLSLYSGGDLP